MNCPICGRSDWIPWSSMTKKATECLDCQRWYYTIISELYHEKFKESVRKKYIDLRS